MAQEAQRFCVCHLSVHTVFIYSRTALAAVGAPTCYNAAACAGIFLRGVFWLCCRQASPLPLHLQRAAGPCGHTA
jgi:hypothetical protein